MTLSKRLFDLACSLALGLILLPMMAIVAVVVLVLDGRPVLYISERMSAPKTPFALIKFRTMKASDQNAGVSGGDKSSRITRTGNFLRRSRIDELPQLWNVIRGNISFVGPRPPLRLYVERYPEIYDRVLKSRPGITGLASVYFHRHEEHLLATCKTAEETDTVYAHRCIPRKAHIDLLYQARQSVCLDISIMFKTVFKFLR
jgi:lipopolysaccharide/colanic/teichoic acid biosynthesis glycosyltransferase